MRAIFGVIIWLIILALLLIPLSILSVLKLIITLLYCSGSFETRDTGNGSHENSFKLFPMTTNDCAVTFASSWKKSVLNVGAALRVEGTVDVDQFREHFANCFNLHENEAFSEEESYSKFFSCIVTRGGYVFRACSKSSLILHEHILEKHLQKWGDSKDTESLEEFLVRWMLEDYREYRPCWEAAVIPLPIDEDSKPPTTVIAFKMHHGLLDGYSLVHIIDKLTGTKSPYLVKDFKEGFGTQLKQMLEAPLSLGLLKSLPPEKNPFRVDLTNNPSEDRKHEWMISFTSFSLEDLKTLRRRNGGVHLASVIWTVLTGAMRRFLLDVVKTEDIPEYIKLPHTLPWPRHPAMISGTKNEDKICNHWTLGFINAPLLEPDPLVRLKRIEEEYVSFLELGFDKFIKRVMHPVLWTMPGSVIEAALVTKDPGFSNGLTSIVGGDSYKLLGHPVTNIHPLLMMNDTAPFTPLNCFTFSHSGRLELTMGANPSSVITNQENLDKICQIFCHDEIANLLRVTNE